MRSSRPTRASTFRFRAAVAAVTLAIAAAACRGDAPAGGEAGTVSDVSVTVPGWSLEEGFRIGGADAGDESRLFGVGGVAEDPEGRAFIVNFSDRRVLVYDTAGTYVRTIGREGRGPGEFGGPRNAVAAGTDALYVFDMQLRRVSRFRRSTGEYVSDFPLNAERLFPLDMRGTRSGHLAVEFRTGPRIGGPARPYIARVDTLTGAVDSLGAVPIDTVARLEVTSEQGPGRRTVQVTEVPFTPRPVWAMDPQGNIVHGTGAEYAVYRSAGSTRGDVLIRGQGTQRPVTERELSNWFDNPARQGWREQMPVPTLKPFFNAIQVDPRGNVWVQTRSDFDGAAWDVWSPDGALLGQVALPGGSRVVGVSENSLYVVYMDDDDIETLVRYRLVR